MHVHWKRNNARRTMPQKFIGTIMNNRSYYRTTEGKETNSNVVNNKWMPLHSFADHLAASLQTFHKIQYCFSANQLITIA
jgi:hypothetical protein